MLAIWTIPYGLAPGYSFIRSEWQGNLPPLSQILPQFAVNGWFIFGLILFILITIEGAYRYATQKETQAISKVATLEKQIEGMQLKQGQKRRNDISLVYDPSFYSVCLEILKDKTEIHRLGLFNVSDRTKYDVEVRLVSGSNYSSLNPQPLPSPLSPIHSTPESPSSFTLHPSTVWHIDMCVDFIRWQPKTKTIQLCYHHNITEKAIPFFDTYKLTKGNKYWITLGITARDTRIETEWSVELSLDKDGVFQIALEEVEVLEM